MRVGSLEIQLLANMATLSRDMKRAEQVVGGSMANVEKSVASAKRAMQALGVGLPLAMITDQVRRMTDQYTKLDAQLRLSTKSQAQYAQGMSDIRRISTVAQADLSATSMLYTRLMNVMQGTGVEQSKLATVTETVSYGLKAYGATAQEASSAALQLSQAMGANRLGGEEFRAVMEAMPNVMKVLADSMGVPLGALRQLSINGKITADEMVKAFGDPAIAAKFKALAENAQTITGAWVVARNELTLLIGEFMKSSGSTNAFMGAFKVLGETFALLAKHMQSLILIASTYVAFLVTKLVVGTVLAIEKSIAHTEALAMNAAANLRAAQAEASLAAAKAATASATAASTVSLLRNTIATVEANTATLAKTVADNAATIAQLNHARSVAQLSGHYYIIRQVEAELVVTTQALAVAQTELNASTARQTRLQAALIAEDRAALKTRADLVKANAAVVVSQNAATASTIGNIAAIGVALRAAAMAHPITAAALAIGTIIVAIANWKDIVDGGKASFTWFMDDFLGGLQFLAMGVGISLGELVQKMSLLANLTWPDLKSGEFKKQWDKLGVLAEQSRIEAAGKIAGINAEALGRERLDAALRQSQDREAWDKLHATKQQQRAAEIAELNTQYVKLAGLQGRSQAEQMALAEDYRVKMSLIDEKYNREAVKAAGNAHTSKMEQALAALEAEASAEEGKLSRVQKVSLAYQALKVKEQTLAEYGVFVLALEQAALLDAQDAQEKLNKQLASGTEAYNDFWMSVEQSTEKLIEQGKQQEWENTLIGKTKEEIAALTLLRENETIAKMEKIRVTMTDTSTAKEIADYEALIDAMKRKQAAEQGKATAEATVAAIAVETKAHEEMWKKVDGFAHDAFDNIFDKGKNAFEEIGKVIKKSILDMLYRMTVQKWIFSIGATVAAGNASANSINGGTSGMSLLQTGQSIWNGFSGGMASSMGSMAMSAGEMFGSAALTEFGVGATYAGAGGTIAGAAAGSAAAGIGATVATAMPYIAAAVAIYSIAKGLGGGETRSGGMYGVDTGGQAKFIAGPSGGQISGTEIMQSINSTNTNINLLLGKFGSAATITGFAGYLESSTGGRGGAYAAGTVGGQRLVANVTGGGETGWGQSLTAGAAATQFADDLARLTLMALQAADDIPPYLQKVFDSINPMTSSPQLINDTIAFADHLRMVRDALVETRTPLEIFRANVDAGTTAFATSAETFRTDFIAAIDAGMSPQVLEQWKGLGAAIDQLAAADAEAAARVVEETARAAEVAAKVLADALKAITTALELALDDAKNILSASIDAEKNTLQVQYEAQLTIARTRIDSITASVGKLTELSSLLRTTVTSMAVGVTRQSAQAQISAALASARAGGALPSAASLQDSIRKLSEPSDQMFGSYVDYMRDFITTSNDISALADLTDVQLTEQERALVVAEQQLEVLTLNYDASITRLDGIWTEATGIKYAVLDVATALANFQAATSAVSAAPQLQALINKEVGIGQAGGITAETYNAMAVTSVASQLENSIASMYQDILGRSADVSGMSYWAASGMTLTDIQAQIAASSEAQARAISVGAQNTMIEAVNAALGTTTNIRAYATGSNYIDSDQLAMLHRGETVTPAAYVDRERAARDETNALLRRLQTELMEIKTSNQRIWRTTEKHDIDGTPPVRT